MDRSAAGEAILTRPMAIIVGAHGLAALTIALTAGLASFSKRPPDHFTRDPLAVMDGPFYIGVMSNLTVGFWFVTAGAGWMIVSVLRVASRPDARAWAMTLASSLLTLLALDDILMLHEEALQRHVGVPESVTVLAYACACGAIALAFRAIWATTCWQLIAGAGMFFAASISVDLLTSGWGWRPMVEDGLKLMGVAGLLAWTLTTGARWLQPAQVDR